MQSIDEVCASTIILKACVGSPLSVRQSRCCGKLNSAFVSVSASSGLSSARDESSDGHSLLWFLKSGFSSMRLFIFSTSVQVPGSCLHTFRTQATTVHLYDLLGIMGMPHDRFWFFCFIEVGLEISLPIHFLQHGQAP